jgi:putative oxidoreductase
MCLSKLSNYNDWTFFVLRLIVGAVFIYHGHQKWGMFAAAPEQMSPTMLSIFRLLAIAEPLAGLALIIGMGTRAAAIGLALVMLSAIYFKAVLNGGGFAGQGGFEFDLVLLGASLVLATYGAGKVSLDESKCCSKK